MTHPCTTWPERYYAEFDPEKRLQLLEQAEAAGEGDPAENAARRTLWALRYRRQRKSAPLGDQYIALWLTLNGWHKAGLPRLQLHSAENELRARLEALRPPEDSEALRTMERRELEHAMELYLQSCAQGSYGTMLMGLMRLGEDQLIEKIAREIAAVTCTVPRWLNMQAECAPLAEAARAAFCAAYPGSIEVLEEALKNA